MRGLVDIYPSNTGWRRNLAAYHNNLASVYRRLGRLKSAREECGAFLSIMQKLTCEDPSNTDWQTGLAAAHCSSGMIYETESDAEIEISPKDALLKKALDEYEIAKTIAQELAQKDPANPQFQRNWSDYRARVAGIYETEEGHLADALNEYESSKRVLLDLARRTPENADCQEDLAEVHRRLGRLWERKGALIKTNHKEEALIEFAASMTITRTLNRIFPQNPRLKSLLIADENTVARLRRQC